MDPTQLILPICLMAAFLAYFFWMQSKRKKAMANLFPAFQRFFARTGYRYVESPQGTPDDQARIAEAKYQQLAAGTQAFEQKFVRDFHGMIIRHDSYMGPSRSGQANTREMSASWSTPLAQPPRVLWQIADKSLDSALKGVKEAFTHMHRVWKPEYPNRTETGDAELDKRFVVYAVDPDATRRVLATPGLKELLLGCAEVDLVVRANAVVFGDPLQKNISAGAGGTLGMMAMGMDYGALMDATLPVHEKMAELLAIAARASA